MNLGTLEAWLVPLGVFVAAVAIGFLARRVLLHRMERLSARTKTDLDDLIVRALKNHLLLWFLLGGVLVSARTSPLAVEHVRFLDRLVAALFVLSLSFVAANLITSLVTRTTAQVPGTFIATSLTLNVLRGVILIVGGLLVLDNLGVEIKPLLTALGVGSLAVALALQPTLSNLFAGLHITLAKPIRIGDFVELESGLQGFIVDIGWRATQLLEGGNNYVVVPNARLAEMIVKNFSLPKPEQSITVLVGVGYGSDLARVEALTLEVARAVLEETPAAVPTFEPQVRFQRFGESSIDFSVVLRVQQFPDRPVLVHEFIKRLKARFDQEGIEIPFPQRVLHGTVDLRAPLAAGTR